MDNLGNWSTNNLAEGTSPTCKLCGAAFYRDTHLSQHYRTVHGDERPFKCKLCPRGFRWRSNLFVHEKSHRPTAQFGCCFCQGTFTLHHNLLKHYKRCVAMPDDIKAQIRLRNGHRLTQQLVGDDTVAFDHHIEQIDDGAYECRIITDDTSKNSETCESLFNNFEMGSIDEKQVTRELEARKMTTDWTLLSQPQRNSLQPIKGSQSDCGQQLTDDYEFVAEKTRLFELLPTTSSTNNSTNETEMRLRLQVPQKKLISLPSGQTKTQRVAIKSATFANKVKMKMDVQQTTMESSSVVMPMEVASNVYVMPVVVVKNAIQSTPTTEALTPPPTASRVSQEAAPPPPPLSPAPMQDETEPVEQNSSLGMRTLNRKAARLRRQLAGVIGSSTRIPRRPKVDHDYNLREGTNRSGDTDNASVQRQHGGVTPPLTRPADEQPKTTCTASRKNAGWQRALAHFSQLSGTNLLLPSERDESGYLVCPITFCQKKSVSTATLKHHLAFHAKGLTTANLQQSDDKR